MKTEETKISTKDQTATCDNNILVAELFLIRVKANHNCWISNIEGDPGRTLVKENAQVYESKRMADLVCCSLNLEYPNRKFFIERF